MAAEERVPETGVSLRDELVVTPPQTNFYTAVMLLERMTPDAVRIGSSGSYNQEALSFRHDISFSFQPNDISAIEWVDLDINPEERLERDKGRYQLTTCVLGLSGADSPLPLYHVEDLVLGGEAEVLQAAFLDLFHNRLTALLYRARSKYVPHREFLRGARDPLSLRVLAAVGVDRGGEHEPETPRREEFLGLAALLATGGGTGRSIENSLRSLLSRQLEDTPLDLKQFCGGWVKFDPSQRNSLGRANSSMALDWVLGTRIKHPAHRARVQVGPMAPDKAHKFSPGGEAFKRVNDVVHALCTEPIDVDLELLIDQDAYPPFILRAKGARVLGQNVFISSRKRAGRLMHQVYPLGRDRESKPE